MIEQPSIPEPTVVHLPALRISSNDSCGLSVDVTDDRDRLIESWNAIDIRIRPDEVVAAIVEIPIVDVDLKVDAVFIGIDTEGRRWRLIPMADAINQGRVNVADSDRDESEIRLLHDAEAARLIRMLPSRLVRLARRGQVPCVLLPDGDIRFDEADLWAWVESHKQAKPSEAKADAQATIDISTRARPMWAKAKANKAKEQSP